MRSRISEWAETPASLSGFLLGGTLGTGQRFYKRSHPRTAAGIFHADPAGPFLQALYGAVDLLVVGKYALAQDVSGVAVGSQIMTTITGLVSSFAMGTTVLLGQKIGAGKKEEGGRIIGTSVVIFFLTGAALTALIPLLSSALARAMNAPEESFAETQRYIAICGMGSVMIVAYNVLGSIMRGLGDSRTPLITVAIASICNIAGDLLLVAGLHMGASGAAVATVVSQTISVLISLLILKHRPLPFSFDRTDIRIEIPILKRMVRFGTPIALQDLLVGLSFLVILAIVNTLGLTASAGVGVNQISPGLLSVLNPVRRFGLTFTRRRFFVGALRPFRALDIGCSFLPACPPFHSRTARRGQGLPRTAGRSYNQRACSCFLRRPAALQPFPQGDFRNDDLPPDPRRWKISAFHQGICGGSADVQCLGDFLRVQIALHVIPPHSSVAHVIVCYCLLHNYTVNNCDLEGALDDSSFLELHFS